MRGGYVIHLLPLTQCRECEGGDVSTSAFSSDFDDNADDEDEKRWDGGSI
jgi:hypothetical protein